MKIVPRPGRGAPRPLPILEAIRDMLADLFGVAVVVDPVRTPPPCAVDLVGIYALADGSPAAGVGARIADAALLGAALAMVPPTTALEQAQSGQLDETLHACFYEVANVLSRLFNGESFDHLRLTELVGTSHDQAVQLTQAEMRRVFDVFVTGYGTARLEMFSLR